MLHSVASFIIVFVAALAFSFVAVRAITRKHTPSRQQSDTKIIERSVIDKALEVRQIVTEKTRFIAAPMPSPLLDLEAELAADSSRPRTLADSATLKSIHQKAMEIRKLTDSGQLDIEDLSR